MFFYFILYQYFCRIIRLIVIFAAVLYAILMLYNLKKADAISIALQSPRKRVMPMSTMEVLTLILVILAALIYIDQHNKK